MELWGFIELTLKLYNVIFSTSGKKSKPEVGLLHTILELFRHEFLPDNEENELASNELWNNIDKPEKYRYNVEIIKNRFLPVFPV